MRRFNVVTAVFLAVAAGFVAAPAAPASAAESRSIGDRYVDGLDSRHSAVRIAQMARGAGYAAGAATDGRTADNAWLDGLSSAVFGFFGHSNAGILQVRDRAGLANDEYIGAGTAADRLPLYANYRFWSEYLPYVDVDDMRLAILAGCYTANSHPSLGDFEEVGTARGIDAIVAFPGLVFYPAKCTSCVYSGNYFWSRFATHYGNGTRLSVALARARSDLVDKEGKAGGWQRYRITGSIAGPGDVRLRPEGSGEPLTSQPGGIDPYSLASLSVVSRGPLPGGLVEEVTDEGVLLRRDPDDGRLVDLWAPSSAIGSAKYSVGDLRDDARVFVSDLVDLSSGWDLVRAEETSHVEGEMLAGFTWTSTSSLSRPARIDLEVDRRTGAVTYLSWAEAPEQTRGDGEQIPVTEAEAIAVRSAAADAEVVSAELFSWQTQQWLVRTRSTAGRGPLGPRIEEFVIDAVTGEVLRRATT